jgi:restriction endonuclease S subunit
MNNLQANGWDLRDLKYIQLDPETESQFLVRKGDILFNRTNSKELVGKCEVFQEDGSWVFASYLIRVRLNESKAIPAFVSDFLNTNAGRVQIDRVSRQIIGMSNINAEELRDLLIPLPPLDIQRRLVAEMEAARESRCMKLNQADELLKSIDGWLLKQLRLDAPQARDRNVYAVRRRDVIQTARLNADYFHPERILSVRAMQVNRARFTTAALREVVEFVRDLRKSPEGRYIGLANVQSHTGEFVSAEEEVQGNCLAFRENDVLFGRLRPYLNKVYRAEFSGVCSPEFHVLRGNGTCHLNPDYLAAILRSSPILAQTRHMMTGNTHPRLTNDDITGLVIPIPDPQVQGRVAAEVNHRRIEARRLRAEAETGWQAAKERFERRLLAGP